MIKIFGKSDVGRIRSMNQDVFITKEISDDAGYIVVCDGMGGENGGNIASENAAGIINNVISGNHNEKTSVLLENAVSKANSYVFEMSRENTELRGMGTTATVAYADGDKLYLAHVGDSRAYLLRKNTLRLLTTDHSVVQMMVDRGEITAEQARTHPQKNYITRAVGILSGIETDIIESDILPGDIVLVCSDGFSNYFENEEIALLMRKIRNENLGADYLIELANHRGGADNITVAIMIKE